MTTQCITDTPNLRAQKTFGMGFLNQTAKRIVEHLASRRKLKQDRDAFNAMLRLEDELMRDIGVTRANVEWASRLPLEKNAADELRRLSQKDGILYR